MNGEPAAERARKKKVGLWLPETGVFFGVWLFLLAAGQSRFFRDPGTLWHTVAGDQMLHSKQLIERDGWSFTFAGSAWIPHQWLAECLMAIAHRLDGFDTLLLGAATLLAAVYACVARRMVREGLRWSIAAAIVALCIAASAGHFHVRPHLGTIALLALTHGLLCDYDAKRIELRTLLWLLPIGILWTNIHGGMLGGLGTIGVAFAGWSILRLLGQASPLRHRRDVLAGAALVLGCAATSFVNPYGWRLPATWFELMRSPILPRIIEEHAPLAPFSPGGLLVLGFAALYSIALAGLLERPRVSWLLPLLWLYLAFGRVRHAPLFAVTAAIAIADILPHTRWARWMAAPPRGLFRAPEPGARDRGALAAVLPLGVVVLAFVLQMSHIRVPLIGHGWARLDPTYWPVDLEPELRRRQNGEGEPRVFNDILFGGFVIYALPRFRVFVDDRCELYGDKWLAELFDAEDGDPAPYVRDAEARYGFRLALTQTGSGFDRYFRGAADWTEVKRTAAGALFERR